jgi:hypothetical protein
MVSTPAKVSKRDVEAFRDFCVSLRSIWRHYQILLEGTDLQRELMQSIAPTFFGDLNQLLIEHLILQICKITDPEASRGRANLTVKFLVNNSDFSSAPGEFDKLKRLSAGMHAFRDKIVPARHKIIGHIDRDSVLLGKPLGAAPASDWDQFWLDLQDFLHIMDKRYIDPNSSFYLNGVAYLSDADNLVTALKESTFFRAFEAEKEVAAKCMDVAFSSKFSEA